MMGDLQAHLPTPTACSAVFDQKWHDLHAPPCCSQRKKGLEGTRVADVEEVKQKTAEALKGIKTDEFKHWFGQWEKYLNGYSASD